MRKYEGKIAEEYDRQRRNNKAYQWQQQIVEAILLKHKPPRILDAPIGTGRFLPVYRQFPCVVLGLDISLDMIHQAKHKKTPDNVILLFGDIFDIGWPEFVVCTRFFGHLNNSKKQLLFSKIESRLLLSHGPDAYQYFRLHNLNILETAEYGDGKHYVSLIERSRDVRAGTD